LFRSTQGGAGCSLGLRLPFSPKFLGALLRHPGITLQLCSQLCSNKHLLPTCTIFDHSPHICQNEYNKYMYSFEVMSVATSIRLTDELEHRIKKLAATTGRSQSFYINQMIEDGIDRVEQIYGILHETEQYQAGNLPTYSSDELRHELGLER